MVGIIDEHGQWERCSGCGEFNHIEGLSYEKPSKEYKYGRDLCPLCMCHVDDVPPECVAVNMIVSQKVWPNSARWKDTDGREVMSANHQCDDALADYNEGREPPNYPVPAIRQWFEWSYRQGPYDPGTDLFKSYVTLELVEQIAYAKE